jgi:pimeloyl-ACP methyl ester carboxylesterase
METLAECTVHFMDAQRIERADVFGFHTGNKIAAAMAAKFPDRVSRTVLVGMTHSLVVDREARDAAIMNIVKGYFSDHAPSADGSHLLRGWAEGFASLSEIWWDPHLLQRPRITEALLRHQESLMVDAIEARRSTRQIYEMNFAFDLAGALKRVSCPTLVIECCVPEEAHLGVQGPSVLELLQQGKLFTLPGAGFDATEEYADDIARETTAFLA